MPTLSLGKINIHRRDAGEIGASHSECFTWCREPGGGLPYLIVTVSAVVTQEIDLVR